MLPLAQSCCRPTPDPASWRCCLVPTALFLAVHLTLNGSEAVVSGLSRSDAEPACPIFRSYAAAECVCLIYYC